MPELPEVEILVRHLRRRIVRKRITAVEILRPRSVWDTTPQRFVRQLTGERIVSLSRRAKYLRFEMEGGASLLIHLGMTGRLSVENDHSRRPAKHDVAYLRFAGASLVFHDPRKFGHLALGDSSLDHLGPEPLGQEFTEEYFAGQLKRSLAPIKVRLLDQRLVAGLGNIYVSEALWGARIDPRVPCRRLDKAHVAGLRRAIIGTLRAAIRFGGGLSLDFGRTGNDDLFFYGSGLRQSNPAEHFDVYDREGKPCRRCRAPIERITQAGRSTFFCPRCQTRS